MHKKTTQFLTLLRALQPEIRKKFKAELQGVFGSFATGKARKSSDVDLIVSYQKGATLFDDARLTLFLESKLKQPVDLLTRDSLKKRLKKEILESTVWL